MQHASEDAGLHAAWAAAAAGCGCEAVRGGRSRPAVALTMGCGGAGGVVTSPTGSPDLRNVPNKHFIMLVAAFSALGGLLFGYDTGINGGIQVSHDLQALNNDQIIKVNNGKIVFEGPFKDS